jgi:hypothetical protein
MSWMPDGRALIAGGNLHPINGRSTGSPAATGLRAGALTMSNLYVRASDQRGEWTRPRSVDDVAAADTVEYASWL